MDRINTVSIYARWTVTTDSCLGVYLRLGDVLDGTCETAYDTNFLLDFRRRFHMGAYLKG